MRKTLIILGLCIGMFALMAAPALAGGNGAVQTELWQINGPTANTMVGTVTMNTTGSGNLIVLVNVNNVPDQGLLGIAPPLEDYDVRVWINGAPYTFFDVLDTNAQGQGNAIVKVELPDYGAATEINVGVVVRDFDDGGLAFYETSPWLSSVPLK